MFPLFKKAPLQIPPCVTCGKAIDPSRGDLEKPSKHIDCVQHDIDADSRGIDREKTFTQLIMRVGNATQLFPTLRVALLDIYKIYLQTSRTLRDQETCLRDMQKAIRDARMASSPQTTLLQLFHTHAASSSIQ